MKYCTYCGKQLFDEAVVCPGCGCPTPPPSPNASQPYYSQFVNSAVSSNVLITKLSERLKINGIIWIVVAVIQIIIGVSGTWLPLIVGILNIVSAIKDLNYSKEVMNNPVGIVKNFEPLTSPIITLVYNIVIGGVIGVAGSIYYFIALRSFVMENKEAFLALEPPYGNQCF